MSQHTSEFLNLVKSGDLEVMRVYIPKHNIDLAKTIDPGTGRTCLFYATFIVDDKKCEEVFRYLVDLGANIEHRDYAGQTVLFNAVFEGRLTCVDILIQHGVKMDERDDAGITPLHYAAREGHYKIAESMIKAGADIDIEDGDEATPLFYAVREGHEDMCNLLISKQANVNKRNDKGLTPLEVARENRNKEMVEYLLKKGAIDKEKAKFIDPSEVTKIVFGKQETKEQESTRVIRSASSGSKSTELKRKEEDKTESKLETKHPYSTRGIDGKFLPKTGSSLTEKKFYQLARLKDNVWHPASPSDIEELTRDRPAVVTYLKNPSLIDKFKMPDPNAVIFDHWDKAAKIILKYLWKQKHAHNFHKPVDYKKMMLDDYPIVVKQPMDLGTIKEKLNTYKYSSCSEFVADVRLVFSNCILYNGIGSEFDKLATKMLKLFEAKCKALSLDYYML
eukprot:TRINITY_DN14963_c0_g1_i21.p1 TRINITY_DN14963_c0_g1~~TRINITY_DN14963_c0_g1_i21.p1  ORF type:complete len:449 (+),score=111.28 TRINITY_DN14963_c0_g1_i21:227-1573(+)